MTNKLNLLAVEKYSKSFATKICDEFFSSNASIDGKQILSLTSFQQVNLFTVKALFEKWQIETQKLRSPYFNYAEPEVQNALKKFMNTLSQYISVKREAFEPLLAKATQETIWLIVQPHKFFSENFRDLPNFRLTKEELEKLGKFIQINKKVLLPIYDKLGERPFVFANEAIDWLDEVIGKTPLESPEQYLEMLSVILPIPADLLGEKKSVASPEFNNSANNTGSFFDNLTPTQEKSYEPVVPSYEPPKPAPLPEEPKVKEIIPEVQVNPPILELPKPPVKEPENQRLNDRHGADQNSLNDRAASSTSILDMHKTRKIEDINQAISLNQRFLFINNLFHGNAEAYNTAILELSSCQSFPEAKEVLLKKYVPKYLWDIGSAEAEEFIDIVRRRFS